MVINGNYWIPGRHHHPDLAWRGDLPLPGRGAGGPPALTPAQPPDILHSPPTASASRHQPLTREDSTCHRYSQSSALQSYPAQYVIQQSR